MTIAKISFLACFLFLMKATSAQQSPEEIVKIFFEKYKVGNTDSALDYLFGTNKFFLEAKEQTDNLKLKLKQSYASRGSYFGNELLGKKTAGSSVVMFTYVVKHDREPLLFRFTFYKPQNTWTIYTFKFNSTIDEELEEASKAYRYGSVK
jgi:hypothetical protein